MRFRGKQRGFSLILVLWIVTLLALITMQYQATARVESSLLATGLRAAEARATAEAGVWLAVNAMLSAAGPPSGRAPIDYQFEFDDVTISVVVTDVSGLINLNRAPADLLDAAFSRPDLDPSVRADIVDAILDWRDVDTESRRGGREPHAIETAWGVVPVRNGFFASVDELRAIPGVSDALYREVRDLFTVFGNHMRLNINAAPPRVLSALPDADAVEVQQFLAERSAGGSTRGRLGEVSRRLLQNGGEEIFSVTATATVAGVTVTLSPMIRIPRRAVEAMTVLAWGGDAA